MSQIFRYRRGQPVNWFHRILRRSNIYCLYCGAFVGEGSAILSNREHLIGRKFVPAGSLGATSFNFIFRACEACNARKASAERHVSAVTLFNSPARLLDPQVDLLARHKAGRDYHPKKKGVLVQDANEHQVIDFVRPGVHIRFGLTGPPQLQPDEVRLLALRHIQGLFALVTTEDPLVAGKARILPDDQFYFYACYRWSDWGNPHLIEIAKRVSGWPAYVNVSAAEGYFKAVLRRGPHSRDPWFWALEWNGYLRLVGGISSPHAEPDVFAGLPDIGWKVLPDGTDRYREEIALAPDADILFAY